MCTVTYLSGPYGRVITSNRDENILRAPALPPHSYFHNGQILRYPKDPDKGGTWFSVRDDGWLGVLLNGAFTPFNPDPIHTYSRGLILIDALAHEKPIESLKAIDLAAVAPFTLLLSHPGALTELRWDGSEMWEESLNPELPGIWSSATLYTPETTRLKSRLFQEFLANHPNGPTPNEIRQFHMGRYQPKGNDFLIARPDGIQTVSITQACPEWEGGKFKYWDSITRSTHLTPQFAE